MCFNSTQFLFMACRAGAEGALKREVARTEPELRPAFSRPGFMTFKHAADRPWSDVELSARQWVFARTIGVSLGRLDGDRLAPLAEDVWRLVGDSGLTGQVRLADIHVWQRTAEPSTEGDSEMSATPLAVEVERAVRAAAPDEWAKLRDMPDVRRPTARNRRVLDIAVVEPGEWWIGYHRAATLPARWTGGVIPVQLPEHAVSRAYAKMEEALAWSALPLATGDECVEIGCAPGGACQALLDRGLFVTGIDPADADARLLAHPRFRHLRKRGRDVRRSEFVGVRWLAADMNIAPRYTLDTVEAIVTHPGVSIRGLVLTLKLSDWREADRLPEFAERVRGWGYRDVRMRQLASGGQEVCLVALRRKALRRLGRRRRKRHKAAD